MGWRSLEKQQLCGISLHGPCIFSLKTTDFYIPQHHLFIWQALQQRFKLYYMMQNTFLPGWNSALGFFCSCVFFLTPRISFWNIANIPICRDLTGSTLIPWEETTSIPTKFRLVAAASLLLHNWWVGARPSHMLTLTTYAALSTGQTPASKPTDYLLDPKWGCSFVLVVQIPFVLQ